MYSEMYFYEYEYQLKAAVLVTSYVCITKRFTCNINIESKSFATIMYIYKVKTSN